MHRHRYHGVLAPNARARSAVIAIGRPQAELPPPVHPAPTQPLRAPPDPEPAQRANPARIRWAVLIARIYEVLPLPCPACGGQMSILAFLTDPPVISAILLHLESGPPRNARCVVRASHPAPRPSPPLGARHKVTSRSTRPPPSTSRKLGPNPPSASTSPCLPASTTDTRRGTPPSPPSRWPGHPFPTGPSLAPLPPPLPRSDPSCSPPCPSVPCLFAPPCGWISCPSLWRRGNRVLGRGRWGRNLPRPIARTAARTAPHLDRTRPSSVAVSLCRPKV